MTILPKKKSSKEKTESDNAEHTHSQLSHSSSGHHAHSDSRSSRRPSPPPRWNSPGPRDDRLENASRYPEEGSSSHSNLNKRRHRSSPHRTVRKHRHDRAPSSTTVAHSSGLGTHSRAATSVEYDEEEDLSGYNSGDEYVPPKHPENIDELEHWFEAALKDRRGYLIKRMHEDGACLFRSVADQVYGDQEYHSNVRHSCIDYMKKNADFFRQYVTEDFNAYLNRKRTDHCHGNHLEIQALSEIYNRPIEVYQYSTDPMNVFHGAYKTDNHPIRLSYHQNMHYNSVIDPYNATIGVGLGLPGHQPGSADKTLMSDALKNSEDSHIEQQMLEDKLRETDWELTQDTIEEQVARESYLQWLRDQEKRARRQASPRSASATCSSASEAQDWWDNVSSPGRPPRTTSKSASNSAQNSPNRPSDTATTIEKPPSPSQPDAPMLQLLAVPLSPKSPGHKPSTSTDVVGRSPSPKGACGGAGFSYPSNAAAAAYMDGHPLQAYGLSDWDEDDIIAQVIAQSQQEYLDTLKKNVSPTPVASCSTSEPNTAMDSNDIDSLPSTSKDS